MDRGKRKVEPERNEEERRQTRLRRSAVMAAEQFGPVVALVNRWIAHQRARRQNASDVRDAVSRVQVHGELVQTLQQVLRTLELCEEEASGSGSGSGQTADPILPEVPPTGANPEVSPTEPKDEAPLAEPKPEPSSPTEPKDEAPLAKPKPEPSSP